MSLLLWRNDKRHFLGVYLSSYQRVGSRFVNSLNWCVNFEVRESVVESPTVREYYKEGCLAISLAIFRGLSF
jgi:hypothetical protein